MRYLSVVVVLVCFFCTVSNFASAQKDVAIVGSSTSACFGATVTDSCYIGRLRTYYNKQLPNDTSIDNGYAVPGYDVYRGMPTGYVPPYTDPNLQPDANHNITKALASHPDVILVNYPTNGFDSLPIANILFCFRTIKQTANDAGVPCFITTTQPRTSAPFNTSVAKAKLAELKDSILLEFGFFAIDFYTGLINPADSSILYDSGDHTHMNDIGHDSLFARVVAKNIFLTALPATFLQFSAVYKNNTNIISWTTAKETQVDYYEIQRSGDGANFTKIGTVSASNGDGNNQYQYTDNQPAKGYIYYKIVIVDKDGKKHASPVMNVFINTGKLSVIKSFARSSSQVMIELQNNDPQNLDIQILNNTGLVVSRSTRKIETGNTTVFIDTPLLSNGVYRIRLTGAKESIVSSFIKN